MSSSGGFSTPTPALVDDVGQQTCGGGLSVSAIFPQSFKEGLVKCQVRPHKTFTWEKTASLTRWAFSNECRGADFVIIL